MYAKQLIGVMKGGCGAATYVHGHECRRKVGGVADFPSRGRQTPTDIDSVCGGGGGCMETSRSWTWRAEADKRGVYSDFMPLIWLWQRRRSLRSRALAMTPDGQWQQPDQQFLCTHGFNYREAPASQCGRQQSTLRLFRTKLRSGVECNAIAQGSWSCFSQDDRHKGWTGKEEDGIGRVTPSRPAFKRRAYGMLNFYRTASPIIHGGPRIRQL